MAKYTILLSRTNYEEVVIEADTVDDAIKKACWNAAIDNYCEPSDWNIETINKE